MYGVVWSCVLQKTHTAILHMDLGSAIGVSQTTPV